MTALTDRPGVAVSPRSLRLVTVTLAVACGATVANLYYAQPLLAQIATSFHVSQGVATTAVTATQIGYAVALLLVLPLGDLLEVKRLASRLLVVTALALVVAAYAPSLWVFLVASVVVGGTSVVAQILVPFAAHLAPADQRGRFVGQVMSGLLIGVLLARTVASEVAAAWGWRSIYLISAGFMLAVAVALLRLLPTRPPDHTGSYGRLLGSLIDLVRTEPVLRNRAVGQAVMFGTFTAYWTAIAYELIGVHRFDQAGIGFFALVGAAGAMAAPLAGRLGDRGIGRRSRGVAIGVGIAAMVLAHLGAAHVALLVASAALLDLAVQGHQVLGQREIYALAPDARSRVNAVYMTTMFIGGATCSGLTGWIHGRWGWSGVTLFCTALQVVALTVWVLDGRRRAVRRTPR
jgi:predicted MFS family arabinose efflux permease